MVIQSHHFSSSELGWFALSRVQSQLINTGISKLNQLLGTDDKKLYSKKLMDIVSDEGPFFSTQAVFIPSFHGSVILSRDIVTGAYMGTSNKVQIVDNFGFSLDAGVMGGVEGMPFPIKINGKAGLAFQRLFSHVKPIQTLKKSMKEPYKNLVVSLLLKKLAHKIDDLSTVSGDSQQAMIVEITNELKDSLAIGESFIITDSLVPQIGGEGQLSISQFFYTRSQFIKTVCRISNSNA
jgi:hypothetical protein